MKFQLEDIYPKTPTSPAVVHQGKDDQGWHHYNFPCPYYERTQDDQGHVSGVQMEQVVAMASVLCGYSEAEEGTVEVSTNQVIDAALSTLLLKSMNLRFKKLLNFNENAPLLLRMKEVNMEEGIAATLEVGGVMEGQIRYGEQTIDSRIIDPSERHKNIPVALQGYYSPEHIFTRQAVDLTSHSLMTNVNFPSYRAMKEVVPYISLSQKCAAVIEGLYCLSWHEIEQGVPDVSMDLETFLQRRKEALFVSHQISDSKGAIPEQNYSLELETSSIKVRKSPDNKQSYLRIAADMNGLVSGKSVCYLPV